MESHHRDRKSIPIPLKDEEGIILNPRRDDWDSSWTQSINNKEFLGNQNFSIEPSEGPK